MIKFDIDRALAGDKVIARDGGEVNQFFVVNTDNGPTLIGYVVVSDAIEAWDIYGGYYGVLNECDDDLFMAPKKLTGFVNVYTDTSANFKFLDAYVTRNEADICAETGRIACIDLSQFNEGEGL